MYVKFDVGAPDLEASVQFIYGQQEMIGPSFDLWGSADPSLTDAKRPGA